MDNPTVGILHPGSLGAAVAACAKSHAASVLWCSAGRSGTTAARAERHGLEPISELSGLLARADVLISLCPPAAAEDVARGVAQHAFAGLYVEANAISPERVQRIAAMLPDAWAVVDAAVVGSPPVGGKRATLYLSGPAGATEAVKALFASTAVVTHVLGSELGQASALKASYTAFQKTSRTLAAVALALAHHHDVDRELLNIAARRERSYLAEASYIPKTAARAWRWAPELHEAADTLVAAGLPDEMLRAAAQTLARWDDSKDAELTLADALTLLARP